MFCWSLAPSFGTSRPIYRPEPFLGAIKPANRGDSWIVPEHSSSVQEMFRAI